MVKITKLDYLQNETLLLYELKKYLTCASDDCCILFCCILRMKQQPWYELSFALIHGQVPQQWNQVLMLLQDRSLYIRGSLVLLHTTLLSLYPHNHFLCCSQVLASFLKYKLIFIAQNLRFFEFPILRVL